MDTQVTKVFTMKRLLLIIIPLLFLGGCISSEERKALHFWNDFLERKERYPEKYPNVEAYFAEKNKTFILNISGKVVIPELELESVNKRIKIPKHIIDSILSTSPRDGKQTDRYSVVEIKWYVTRDNFMGIADFDSTSIRIRLTIVD